MRQPAAGIGPKRIAVGGKGKAFEATAALVAEATAAALGRQVRTIPQCAQNRALLVNLGQRSLKDIPHPQPHPPAGVDVTIWHYGEERIASRAVVKGTA